ncbi:hypothetical protein [Nocardioides rubriscoriae]|uniref:hypothetical protein n=1 Tax=Nocardioides rubriscoriae TaxID=642762 RepID=UPI0011DFDDF0|nr:hypothetical protein [Nocardioides rubriscoriae]
MRTPVSVVSAVSAVLLLTLAACGSDDGPSRATDPATQSPLGPAAGPPTVVPAAPGPVRSVGLPTVMDTGDGPELCLGAVAESYPPQCSGPAVRGWDWADQAPNVERQGDIRWGSFAVAGTWDGTTFTVSDAIPGALYDPAPEPPVDLPDPSVELSQAELEALATELTTEPTDALPGVLAATPDQEGHVLVDVTYDDGTLQQYVDDAYGAGVVVVRGALVDA